MRATPATPATPSTLQHGQPHARRYAAPIEHDAIAAALVSEHTERHGEELTTAQARAYLERVLG